MIIDYSLNKSQNKNKNLPFSVLENSNSSIVSYLNNKEKDRDFILKEKMKIKAEKVKVLIEKSKNAEAANILKQIYLNSTGNNNNYCKI
jgi:hypothetical protein